MEEYLNMLREEESNNNGMSDMNNNMNGNMNNMNTNMNNSNMNNMNTSMNNSNMNNSNMNNMNTNMNNNNMNNNMEKCNGYIHVIKSGDTLYKLAKEYDVRLMDIMRMNPYVNVYNLQVGDEICIPMNVTPMEEYSTYNVKDGDTLSDIMNYFGRNYEELLKYNPGLRTIKIPVGGVIRYPARGREV